MDVKRAVKIVAVGLVTALMLGATMLVAGCGVSQADYDKIASEKLISEIVAKEAQDKYDVEHGLRILANSDISNANAANLEKTKQIEELDAKNKELLLQIAKEIETTEGIKVLEEEAVDGLLLGQIVPLQVLDNNDLSFLSKGKVTFDEDKYDYRETIALDKMKIGTSYTDEIEFEENPYLLFTDEGAAAYRVNLEDSLDSTKITEDESLVLPFLDGKMEIVEVVGYTLTINLATDIVEFEEKETKNVSGHSFILNFVNEDKAKVTVDGVSHTINEKDSWKFGDFVVRVGEITYQDYAGGVHSVSLEFGKEVLKDISDGDDYSKDNDKFLWEVRKSGDELISVGLVYNEKADDLDEPILGLGKTMDFLGYFNVGFNLEDQYEYAKFDLSFDEVTPADIPALKIKSSGENIKIGMEELKEAYFDGTNAYYKDSDNDWVITADPIILENGDISTVVSYSGGYLDFTGFKLNTADFAKFGALEEAEPSDLTIGGINFGSTEESLLLPNGVVLDKIESGLDDDQFSFKMPDRVVEAQIEITKQ